MSSLANELARQYAIHLVPATGGGYRVRIPAFPDLILTGGDTAADAARNGLEALALLIDGYLEDGEPLPLPQPRAREAVS